MDLFDGDRKAMLPLPANPFEVIRHASYRTDGYGKICIGKKHRYSAGTDYAHRRMLVGFTARKVILQDPVDRNGSQLLYRIISDSYEHRSPIITTNLPFQNWGTLFTDEQLAAAMIDRLMHHGYLIGTGDKSWRMTHALMHEGER